MSSLKEKVIRLAYEKPELREHLLPLVKEAADTFKCPECGTKVMEQTGYCVKCQEKVKKADLHKKSMSEDYYVDKALDELEKNIRPWPGVSDVEIYDEYGYGSGRDREEGFFAGVDLKISGQKALEWFKEQAKKNEIWDTRKNSPASASEITAEDIHSGWLLLGDGEWEISSSDLDLRKVYLQKEFSFGW